MTIQHPYKLRPYHNPENVDESKVPDGWRFRYEDEMNDEADGFCRTWGREIWIGGGDGWSSWQLFIGTSTWRTYIVPVAP